MCGWQSGSAVRRIEDNCLAVDVPATWKETKTGWRIRL